MQKDQIKVIDDLSKKAVGWDGSELRKRIDFAISGLDISLKYDSIYNELRRSIFSGIGGHELKNTIILNAKSLIEKDADFAKFAGRILLSYIYEEVLDWNIIRDGPSQLTNFHRKKFESYIRYAVEIGRLDPLLKNYNLKSLSNNIDYLSDLNFDYLGVQILYDRYLIVDKTSNNHKRIETPQFFWIRVAMGLFIKEKSEDKEKWVVRLYNLYKNRLFCSSTPTLFNSGTLHPQLSSCYLYKVNDDIESIMYRGIAENAFLSKWAGGLGGSWTSVRGLGSYIQGTNGESQGVIPFLKMHNDQLVAVNQGGKRRGSGVVYLESWHNDIYDFLELRKNTGDERRRAHDMNTANWIPDLFMKRMERRESWTLFRSNEVPDLHDLFGREFEKKYIAYERKAVLGEIFSRRVPAIEMWKYMLMMIFETGHPWITFKDPCNIRNQQSHVGIIHSSNLCTEITLNTGADETAVCNLGSIVLDSHLGYKSSNIDLNKLRDTIRVAVRALDNVIDINFYPTEASRNSNFRHRPIGIGVMGLQNTLYEKKISFASNEAISFSDEFMEKIAYYAYEASSDLAAERGTYMTYKDSKWDKGLLPQDTIDLLENERKLLIKVSRGGNTNWLPLRKKIKEQGMRNSNILAIAPTATISNIVGTTPCIEPAYKNLYVKSNLSGECIALNKFLIKDLKIEGVWQQKIINELKYHNGELENINLVPSSIKKLYRTAFSIPYKYIISAAARRQKWIDQAQSINLFLSKPNIKLLSHMYREAWHQGIKTTYYLRTLGASNIEKSTIKTEHSENSTLNLNRNNVIKNVKSHPILELNEEECESCQ